MIACRLLVLSLLFTSPVHSATDVWDGSPLDELRLRLPDGRQDRLTTSVDWVNLDPHRFRSAGPVEVGPAPLRILLDPGHGGRDEGAHSVHGTLEKDICLRLAHLTRRILLRKARIAGIRIEVRLTREGDETLALSDRAKLANAWEPDAFVSIHANSSPFPGARGFEVYFLSSEASDSRAHRLAQVENGVTPERGKVLSILSDVRSNVWMQESGGLAEEVFQALSRRTPAMGRAIRQAPFHVLGGTHAPSILLEVGYLTHRGESRRLHDRGYLKSLSDAISSGVLEFLDKRKERYEAGWAAAG